MNARPGYTLAAYNRESSIFLEYIACYNETSTDFVSYEEFCRWALLEFLSQESCVIFRHDGNVCEAENLRYKFENDWLNSSLVTDYNFICDADDTVKNAKSLQMVGFFIAAMLQVISDQPGSVETV